MGSYISEICYLGLRAIWLPSLVITSHESFLDQIWPPCDATATHTTRTVLPQQSTRRPGHPIPELQIKGEHCRLQWGETYFLSILLQTSPLSLLSSLFSPHSSHSPHSTTSSSVSSSTHCAAHHSFSRARSHWICAVWRAAGMVQSMERTLWHRFLQVTQCLFRSYNTVTAILLRRVLICCAMLFNAVLLCGVEKLIMLSCWRSVAILDELTILLPRHSSQLTLSSS